MSHHKLFNLISEKKSIRLAPGKKVIPAGEFTVALDAVELFATTEREAENFRVDVAKEIEQQKELAEQEGFNAGLEKWAEQLGDLEEKASKLYKDLNKMIIPVALTAAKKIVGREMEHSTISST